MPTSGRTTSVGAKVWHLLLAGRKRVIISEILMVFGIHIYLYVWISHDLCPIFVVGGANQIRNDRGVRKNNRVEYIMTKLRIELGKHMHICINLDDFTGYFSQRAGRMTWSFKLLVKINLHAIAPARSWRNTWMCVSNSLAPFFFWYPWPFTDFTCCNGERFSESLSIRCYIGK